MAAYRVNFIYLIGIVVSCVVEVVANSRGQHDQQVNAVHPTPQVSQPDQAIHLFSDRATMTNRMGAAAVHL